MYVASGWQDAWEQADGLCALQKRLAWHTGICRLVERHFRHAPSPLACLDASLNTGAAVSGSQAAAQASTGSRQSTAAFPAAWVLAGAALRLVQLMPLQRRLHDQGTLLRLLQHTEADVRWLAARSLALLYNLVRSWRCGVARHWSVASPWYWQVALLSHQHSVHNTSVQHAIWDA